MARYLHPGSDSLHGLGVIVQAIGQGGHEAPEAVVGRYPSFFSIDPNLDEDAP